MSIDESLMCSFQVCGAALHANLADPPQVLRPAEKKSKTTFGTADAARATTPPRGGKKNVM